MINHYDTRRSVCVTILVRIQKVFCEQQSRCKKTNLDSIQFRFTNKIITAEQSNKLQKLYVNKNYSCKANLLICERCSKQKYFQILFRCKIALFCKIALVSFRFKVTFLVKNFVSFRFEIQAILLRYALKTKL